MMKIRAVIYRWMIAAWLMTGCALPAFAQTGIFRTSGTASDAVATGTSDAFRSPATVQATFRSTSSMQMSGSHLVNSGASLSAPGTPLSALHAPSGPRRGPWDPPEDDPIGVLPDPQPVGEPLILLLFAALYIAYRKHKKHLKHTEL